MNTITLAKYVNVVMFISGTRSFFICHDSNMCSVFPYDVRSAECARYRLVNRDESLYRNRGNLRKGTKNFANFQILKF